MLRGSRGDGKITCSDKNSVFKLLKDVCSDFTDTKCSIISN